MSRARHACNAGPLVAACLALGSAGACLAQQQPGGAAAAEPAYQRPAEYTQPRRVGGAARGLLPHAGSVTALVPDHLGLTADEQPTLYWLLSAPTAQRIEIVLTEPEQEKPLLELSVAGDRRGLHAVDLRSHAVRLRPGVEYEWSVAIVVNPAQRASDVVSGGTIMRVAEPTSRARAARWYDMLSEHAARTLRDPDDREARQRLSALLEQVGLGGISFAEGKQ